ncbi:hypothetical protein DUNSADRAFT_7410 [Dunaliella salina]|uniref:Encoded protein n=1 Tax=Dunaliella salina TaxID=3046 RepID=A0ABQ7H6I9_DUNSA|nr:hypothetical protein DUNSADRAFT_7410 [Dunaliella salina]|eukprot:KAF5842426.1 hypothetical protein DUNSADRAFT_7410 [Dunaliella salina]
MLLHSFLQHAASRSVTKVPGHLPTHSTSSQPPASLLASSQQQHATGCPRAQVRNCKHTHRRHVRPRAAPPADPVATSSVTPGEADGGGKESRGVGSGRRSLRVPSHWEDQMRKAPVGKRRVLQRYCNQLELINELEPTMMSLNSDQLCAKTGGSRGS